jgi:hypothetical protein
MQFALTLFTLGCGESGGDSATTGPESLAERLADTEWDCRWISLNAPLSVYPSPSSRVEVEHSLSFTATTLNDDLPARLEAWATSTPETYAKDVAYLTGWNALGTAEVQTVLDAVEWTPVSDETLLHNSRDTRGRFVGNISMTVGWDGEGMWFKRSFVGLESFSRCEEG